MNILNFHIEINRLRKMDEAAKTCGLFRITLRTFAPISTNGEMYALAVRMNMCKAPHRKKPPPSHANTYLGALGGIRGEGFFFSNK